MAEPDPSEATPSAHAETKSPDAADGLSPATATDTSSSATQGIAAVANEPASLPPGMERQVETYAFHFHGDEREYFRIWIINTLLTLLTCGVFAAWAKVRKRRYFRGNTELMGHRFDYRADPRRILIGNMVVVVLFLAYAVFGEVYPWVRLTALGVGVVALPWIVVRSLAFNAHNTCYRGLRFVFKQTYGMAALTYLGLGLAVIGTAGLYYPAWMRHRRHFALNHHRLGDAFFRFDGKTSQFYSAYILGGGLIIIAAILGTIVTGSIIASKGGKLPTLTDLLPFFLIYGLAFFVGKHLIYARLFNHVWNHTRLDEHRFVATLRTGPWLRLQMGNLVAVIGTAGLLYPWAQIRAARHALAHLHFQPAAPIEKIERLGRKEGSALGETAGEFFGLDFGL